MSAWRIGRLTLAVLLGLAAWSLGPTLPGLTEVWAGDDIGNKIIGLLPGAYQVSYFDVSSSFTKSQQGYGGPGHSGGDGDALLRVVDVGNFPEFAVPFSTAGPASPLPVGEPGSLCANIYVFDDDQEMQECCSCPLTADSVQTFSVINNLTSNPQFSSPLGVGVIKIVASELRLPVALPGLPPSPGCTSGGNGVPGLAGSLVPGILADGLTAWISHAETIATNNPSFAPPFGFVTNTSVTHFASADLDSGELLGANGLVPLCLNIELHASGRGICTCGIGS
jgi:hypothetical protein